MKLKFTGAFFMSVVALSAIGCVVSGCGDSDGPDPAAQAKSLDKVQKMRAIFEKANGEWNNLTETDRAEFESMAGGAENAKLNWDAMKHGPGAADRPAGGQ